MMSGLRHSPEHFMQMQFGATRLRVLAILPVHDENTQRTLDERRPVRVVKLSRRGFAGRF